MAWLEEIMSWRMTRAVGFKADGRVQLMRDFKAALDKRLEDGPMDEELVPSALKPHQTVPKSAPKQENLVMEEATMHLFLLPRPRPFSLLCSSLSAILLGLTS